MAYLLALLSALLYGAGDFTGGLATRKAATLPVVLVSQLCGLVLLALIIGFLPDAFPTGQDIGWGVAAGLSGGIGVALLYRALATGVMAVVAPTTAVCAVVIPVAAAMALGERPSLLVLAGIVLGVVSIVLVGQQTIEGAGEPRPTRVGMALLSGMAIGVFLLAFARTGTQAGMWPLLVARVVSVSLFLLIGVTTRTSLRLPRGLLWLTLGCGVLDMSANALYLLAARIGPLSPVVTLSSLYPASTVLLARLVLRDRLNAVQAAGVLCALTAVVLIVRG